MPLHLHLLNSRGRLDGLRARIEACFEDSARILLERLPLEGVDVIVYAEPESVIPELGVGGYSPSADRVLLRLDPAHPYLLAHFETEFLALLGHELHHCARNAGPGYGRSLREALVSEGLACAFEVELRGGEVPFYARVLDAAQLDALHGRALKVPDGPYDHAAWFFGTQAQELPRHAGYTLGYEIARRHIARTGLSPARLAQVPAEAFYADV